ncbi:Cupredoxin [Pyronema domesticum]|nr:Cupredoxin [Pyronema domesticum]
MSFAHLLSILLLASSTLAKTVTYDFSVTWTKGNPDGQYERKVIGINGQWPIPQIDVDLGDRLVINFHNGLPDQDSSLHFHGLFQNGTTFMDGPAMVSQCPVPPGMNITYDFIVDQPGTYWYHSHVKGQYPDGIRGAFIVHDPQGPYKNSYDAEIILTLSDWYHEQMPVLAKRFISYLNPTGAEPVPQSALMNDSQNITLAVEPGKTYMVRMVNMAAFAAQYVWFEEHTMKVIEIDGIYTEPMDADMLYLTAAQRVSVLITTKNDTSKNYAFMGSMDQDLFDKVPDGLNPNVTGWLSYNSNAPLPAALPVPEFKPLDDMLLIPYSRTPLLPPADLTVTLNVTMSNLGDGANYAFFNGLTYVRPQVPTLFTALSVGDAATNPLVYGRDTVPHILPHMQIIDIVINNQDPGKHPFHLHGHVFQTIFRSSDDAGNFEGHLESEYPKVPMIRDTILAPPGGHVVLRFRADNPGVWLFHCHLEWHLLSGLVTTFIEAPMELQRNTTIPENHRALCVKRGILMEGNAVGRKGKDVLDLRGENRGPDPLPEGFTARGIVALAGSTVTAILGMGAVVWYGGAQVPGEI